MPVNFDALAIKARADPDELRALWEAVRRWACWIAARYTEAAAQNGAADRDDLDQCAALGVIRSVRTYEAHRGAFLAWAAYYIRQEVRELLGLSGRVRREHYNARSLDAPVAGDDGYTLGDTIPAAGDIAEEASARADDESIIQTARQTLRDCPASWAMIEAVDLEGLTIRDAAQAASMTPDVAAKARRKGLRILRHAPCMRVYNPYMGRHRGLATYRSTNTSITEAAALWNINAERA